jgi:hypothetical protein
MDVFNGKRKAGVSSGKEMTDLRALLVEAREQMIALTPGLMRNFLVERIDAALAEKEPGPVLWAERDSAGAFKDNTCLQHKPHFGAFEPLYAAPPPASPGGAIPQGLDFARQRNMAVTDEWLRGWEGARQFAMGNTGPNPCNAPQEIQASPDNARDAARWRALRNWPFAQTRLVHGTDWPTWGPGTDFPEAGDVIDAWIDRYMADNRRAAIEPNQSLPSPAPPAPAPLAAQGVEGEPHGRSTEGR